MRRVYRSRIGHKTSHARRREHPLSIRSSSHSHAPRRMATASHAPPRGRLPPAPARWCGPSLPANAVYSVDGSDQCPSCRWSRCANLAVPATGSESLHQSLATLSKLAHHQHWKRAEDMPLANCLIITFRDPVQRYLSAFHYDALRHRSRSFSLNWMRSRQKPNEFIDALRDHNAQHHIVATRTLNASLFPIYIRGINGVHNNGNNFLVPQADFLRGAIAIARRCTCFAQTLSIETGTA